MTTGDQPPSRSSHVSSRSPLRARPPNNTGVPQPSTAIAWNMRPGRRGLGCGTHPASENVQLPMLGRGLSRSQRSERAKELLDEVGLTHRRSAYPGTLSGGERQRVAIARALANEPRLLLADEPTGALDTATGGQIVELLKSVRAQRGTTVLLVTNDPDVADTADRILRIRDGRIEEVIPAEAPRSASA